MGLRHYCIVAKWRAHAINTWLDNFLLLGCGDKTLSGLQPLLQRCFFYSVQLVGVPNGSETLNGSLIVFSFSERLLIGLNGSETSNCSLTVFFYPERLLVVLNGSLFVFSYFERLLVVLNGSETPNGSLMVLLCSERVLVASKRFWAPITSSVVFLMSLLTTDYF